MRMDRFTSAAQEVLAGAQTAASGASHPEVGGLHLLSAMLADRNGPGVSVLKRAGAPVDRLAGIVAG
jgi:ATP-dependent Clp protease ATP-binding subunit ClpA